MDSSSNENSVFIYSASSGSKLLLNTNEDVLKNVVNETVHFSLMTNSNLFISMHSTSIYSIYKADYYA